MTDIKQENMEDDLSKTINKGLDEAYNAGIDHAAGLVKALQSPNGERDWLVKKILELKKPTV